MKHHVERAVILAAGIGEELRPVTFMTPTPLVRVHGRRMIDSLIQDLNKNGIQEIYVVVDYLKEQFAYLETEYQDVKLVENPYYDECDSIASLYCVREHLENAMILDGNQLIYDPVVLSTEFDGSGFNAVRADQGDSWQLYGISRWTPEDGKKLRRHLEIEFEEKQNSHISWEDIALSIYPKDYALTVREMCPDDVVSIDTLEELAAIESGYSALVE